MLYPGAPSHHPFIDSGHLALVYEEEGELSEVSH